ncbi:EbsA family protein [Leuconostoc miyukkimchii]|uniref:EbsA family protein n=1 Tax=Leuconostoc miyukkimchii TaxID=910540 RepID=UPI001C7CA273|nr:EbsA family protein [Leuconostoc miyukkimchii]
MIPKRGFFQPLDITGQIGWLWWLILLMVGVILWSEVAFKIELIPIAYILVILVLGVFIISRRRIYVAGSKLFLGRLFVSDYEKISLMTMDNWRLDGHVLSFMRAGRYRKYWLSQNVANQIKEYMNTHDGTNNY